jgi:replicative DNA helicase
VLTTTFEALAKQAENGGSITGIPTHFVDLDKKTAGLHAGDLMIVAARTGVGKSSLVLNMAVNVAAPQLVAGKSDQWEPGHTVAVFSLEMPKEQVAARLVCSEARVDLGKLRQGYLSQEEWGALTSASGDISRMPIWIDDTPALTLMALRGRCRRLRSQCPTEQPLGLVVVDYLQLMRGDKSGNREQEVGSISRGLKELAKDLQVPVVALSQLNRSVETRGGKDKRPMLSDLRESGSVEMDADAVVFIYREDVYDRESPDKGMAELIIAKQRNGPTGTVKVRFVANYTRFDNLAPGEYEDFDDYG